MANLADEPSLATLDLGRAAVWRGPTVKVLRGTADVVLPTMRLGPREVVVLGLDG